MREATPLEAGQEPLLVIFPLLLLWAWCVSLVVRQLLFLAIHFSTLAGRERGMRGGRRKGASCALWYCPRHNILAVPLVLVRLRIPAVRIAALGSRVLLRPAVLPLRDVVAAALEVEVGAAEVAMRAEVRGVGHGCACVVWLGGCV